MPIRWHKFCCWMNWHVPIRRAIRQLGDGVMVVSWCLRCGQRVCLDSRGNWFRIDESDAND